MRPRHEPGTPKAPSAAKERTPLARKLLQHQRWAGAIKERFRRQSSILAWHPESLVYSLLARQWFLLFRSSLQSHFQRQSSSPAHTYVSNTFRQQLVLPSRLLRSSEKAVESTVLSNAVRRNQLPAQRGPQPPRSVAPYRQSTLARRVEVIRSLGTHTCLALQNSIEISRQTIRRERAGADLPVGQIGARITRQMRRVDRVPLSQSLESTPTLEPKRKTGDFVLDKFRPLPQKETPQATRLESVPAVTPQLFNVTRLTDEVMRQIDRRLIASRERLGKI